MDPITHMLTGTAIADALSARDRLGKGSLPFAAFLAAAPDLDVIPALIAAFPSNPFSSSLFDARTMHALHRGYTHAFPILAAAVLVTCLFARAAIGKKGPWPLWTVLAALTLSTHSMMDMANGAIRAWLPFSPEWVGWGQARRPTLLSWRFSCSVFWPTIRRSS